MDEIFTQFEKEEEWDMTRKDLITKVRELAKQYDISPCVAVADFMNQEAQAMHLARHKYLDEHKGMAYLFEKDEAPKLSEQVLQQYASKLQKAYEQKENKK